MARYSTVVTSSAAIAVDTGFAWLRPVATCGGKLRRVTVGVGTSTAVVPTSQQQRLGIARITNAGTTPGGAVVPGKMDPNSGPALCVVNTTYATPPTVVSVDQWAIPFNTQSGGDLPWELMEEAVFSAGTTDGFAFINRGLAMPSGHFIVLTFEHEE
jgi:hypothetical protein